MRLSRDGARIAYIRWTGANPDLWLASLSGNGGESRLTTAPALEDYPVWSPDGRRVAFSSNRAGTFDLYQHPSDGSGGDEVLLKNSNVKFATDWSPDGRFLLYYEIDPKSKRDLWLLPTSEQGERTPMAVLQTEFNEANGRFSPDGRWITYTADDTGTEEVYVQPSPGGGKGRWLVSQGGGALPMWSANGREIYYRDSNENLMVVPVTATGAAFQAGIAKRLFKVPVFSRSFDRTADGQKFILALPDAASAQTPFSMVLHWMSLLKK